MGEGALTGCARAASNGSRSPHILVVPDGGGVNRWFPFIDTSTHPTKRQQLTVRIVRPPDIYKNMFANRHLQTRTFALEYGLDGSLVPTVQID